MSKIYGQTAFEDLVAVDTATGITAHPDGSQASAAPLNASYNNVTIAAATYASVRLATNPKVGTVQIVKNSADHLIRVYPALGAQIQTMGVNNPVELSPEIPAAFWEGETYTFIAVSPTHWMGFFGFAVNQNQFKIIQGIVALLGQTSVGGDLVLYSWMYQPNGAELTAHAGGGFTDAVPINSKYLNVIGTCANDHDSIKLVEVGAIGGVTVCLVNRTAKIVDVYPYHATFGVINNMAPGAPYELAPNTAVLMVARTNGAWNTITSAT